MKVDRDRLCQIIARFPGRRVVVVGDLMLDEYVFGSVTRISPEAPVPVVDVDCDRHTYAPGGASNVVHNLSALGAIVAVVGVVGEDPQAEILKERLQALGVDVSGVLVDPERPTTLKTRIIAHTQQVVRIDRERRHPVSAQIADRLLAAVEKHLQSGAEALLISDYDKGVVSGPVAEAAIRLCQQRGVLVTANPKPANLERFCGVTAVVLNHPEMEASCGRRLPDEKSLRMAGEALRARLNVDALLITRGSLGMMLIEAEGRVIPIPAIPVEVYDVVGAGDTAFSALTLALTAGASLVEAATLANLAGGAVVRKAGTAVVTLEELRQLAGDE